MRNVFSSRLHRRGPVDRPGLVPSWLLEETSRKLGTKEMEQKLGIQSNYDLMPKERQELQEKIQSMGD